MNTALATRIAREHAVVADTLPPQVVSAEQRRRALQIFTSADVPTARDENWRYANLRSLEHVHFAPRTEKASAITTADLPARIDGYARCVFIDGLFAPQLSDQDVSGMGHRAASHDWRRSDDMRLALLNDAFATDAARIVATKSSTPHCIELIFIASTDAAESASYPRLELQLEPQAQVSLIERHLSYGNAANFINAAVNVAVAAGATLDHYRVQQTGAQTTWLDTLTAKVETDANYRLYCVNLGARSARSTLHVELAGERAQLALHAVSVADGQQVQDLFAVVEHAAPRSTTEETFRGIAADRAQVAFNGKIVVRERAAGTDSRQSLRGLLAGPQAEIDVRPQLEIYTDDVRCSHGATAGKLDDTMLFYLLSRGIDRPTAQRLLEWAFLEDVIAKISIPELRRQIEQSLPGRIEEQPVLEAQQP